MTIRTMQQRRGSASAWSSANPILAAGEFGYESDTGKLKIGDGATVWASLAYAPTAATLTAAINAVIDAAPGALDTLNELAAALGDDPNFAATITAAVAGKQPLDSDLTAIAALTTTAFGRSLLTQADAAAVRAAIGAGSGGGDASTNTATSVDSEVVLFSGAAGKTLKRAAGTGIAKLTAGVLGTATAGTDYQAPDADLTAIAALTTTTYGRAFLTLADAAAARAATGAAKAVTFLVDDYGADPTGATSSNTAIAAARTAMGSNPGVLEFGVGTYTFSTPVTALGPYQGITGQGRGQTILKFSGTGAAISAFDTRDPIYTFTAQLPGGAGGPGLAGPLKGFTLLGNSPGSNSTGIHIGDLTCVDMDVVVANFAGSGNKGIWFDNQKTWLERANVDAHVANCTQAYVFDAHGGTVSYEYSDFNLSAHCVANQDGIVLTNDANIIGKLRFYGNFEPGVTNTGVAVKVGAGSLDLAYIYGDVDFHCESVGSGVHHKDIDVNGNQGYIGGRGTVKFNGPFVAGNAFGRVRLLGSIDTPSLGRMDLPQSARALGMMGLTWGYLGPTGDWYPGMGNVFLRQMTAGTQTFSVNYFTQPTNTAAEFDIFIQQPASGSTTLTWPGTFTWVDGVAPTLSSTPNTIDHIRVVTADFGTFYAKHVNATFAPGVHAATGKTTPADADELALVDNSAANGPKKLTWANLKAAIKAYYDDVTSIMTNKTLTDPKINAVKDTNGNAVLDFSAVASAVNRLRVNNAASGGWPSIEPLGPGGGMSLSFSPTGYYTWVGAAGALDYAVDGSATDVGFNVITKAAGRLKENGNIAATWVSVPATASSTGKQGQQAADSSWLYICTATNTWRRVAIASW